MARFDVYRHRGRNQLLLDCQSDTLVDLPTRFVLPLIPVEDLPRRIERLHPIVSVAGQRWLVATHFAASIDTGALGGRVGSLANEHYRILNAIDALISDF